MTPTTGPRDMPQQNTPAFLQLTRKDPSTGQIIPIPAAERLDRIISHPQAKAVIRQMDPQSLYSLIAEAGINEALDVVLLAAPEQIQSFLDYECWRKDEFDLATFTEWMELLLQADDDAFVELLHKLDPEAIAIWIRENVAVFEWESDRDLLDTIDDPISSSPGGVFALVFPLDPDAGTQIRLLLERLYAYDIKYAISLLQGARWEITADMSEQMYQARTNRLADQGFAPFSEAIEVYAWQDPVAWIKSARARLDRADQGEHVFAPLAGDLMPSDSQLQSLEARLNAGEHNTYARAISALGSVVPQAELRDAANSVLAQFRAVTNRAHVADQGNPGDQRAARAAADRVQTNVGIALELLAPDDIQRQARALLAFPLKELHRVGFSATRNLALQVKPLVARGNLSLSDEIAFSLLWDEDAELLKGLLLPRPTLHAGRGTPFRSFDDVRRAAERLGVIAFAELLFFAWMRMDRSSLAGVAFDPNFSQSSVDAVSFRSLFATFVANGYIDTDRAMTPLTLTEFEAFVAAARADGDVFGSLLDRARARIKSVQPEDQDLAEFALRFASEACIWLAENIDALHAPIEPRVAAELVLLAPGGPMTVDARDPVDPTSSSDDA